MMFAPEKRGDICVSGNIRDMDGGPNQARRKSAMKSNNPPDRRMRGRTDPRPRNSRATGKAVILDFVQNRIEAYNKEQGGGIFVRKDRTGYTLIREDSGMPVARLRPRPQEDPGQFEVLYWSSFHESWRQVGTIAGTTLSLDDALEFIARDPMDCFWR
jgi:hypothetical protein